MFNTNVGIIKQSNIIFLEKFLSQISVKTKQIVFKVENKISKVK